MIINSKNDKYVKWLSCVSGGKNIISRAFDS